MEAKRFRGSGSFSGVPSRGQSQHRRGHPFRHTQPTRSGRHGGSSGHGFHGSHRGHSSLSALPDKSSNQAPSIYGSSMLGSSSGHPVAWGSLQSPPPLATRVCFECGDLGHIKRFCPRLTGGSSSQRSQPSASSPVTSPPAQSARGGAQSAKDRPRGGG
uniref:Uncharacterized protein LOC104225955 n=1 Tax=Nicotiana sylvestris TaxID=4096 RepID=A0A1U7WN90_NICSY|nr:PREDICTED: uncharacterized protein LOC104225955 [Nicotiana sylvestris]